MKVEIRSITAAETRNLRQLILRPHQNAEELVYEDDDHPDSIHLGAYINGKLEGIASLYKHRLIDSKETESWRLRGMATSENFRSKGIGILLMNECIKLIQEQNGKIFWCNARTTAEGFYEKFGMKRHGGIFTPEGLGPHIVMLMNI